MKATRILVLGFALASGMAAAFPVDCAEPKNNEAFATRFVTADRLIAGPVMAASLTLQRQASPSASIGRSGSGQHT
jgi:hypothetical protein